MVDEVVEHEREVVVEVEAPLPPAATAGAPGLEAQGVQVVLEGHPVAVRVLVVRA